MIVPTAQRDGSTPKPRTSEVVLSRSARGAMDCRHDADLCRGCWASMALQGGSLLDQAGWLQGDDPGRRPQQLYPTAHTGFGCSEQHALSYQGARPPGPMPICHPLLSQLAAS